MAFFNLKDDKYESSVASSLEEKIWEAVDSAFDDNKDICEYIKSSLGMEISNDEIFLYSDSKDRVVEKIKDFVYGNISKTSFDIKGIKVGLRNENNSLKLSFGCNAPKVDGVENWKLASSNKDNLRLMLDSCKSEIRNMVETGQAPAPYYFERVAILAKKEKMFDLEVLACETYIGLCKIYKNAFKACNKNPPLNIIASPRYLKIKERLPKAKENLKKSKASQKTKK